MAEDFHHDIPTSGLARLFTGAFGGIMTVTGVQETFSHPYPGDTNPLFTFGYFMVRAAVGFGLIYWALFAPAQHWTVGQGSIMIETRNLFRRRRTELGAQD